MQVRMAEARDADAIVAVINVAFRLAEGFLIDCDRIDLATIQELLQKGTFLVAEDKSRKRISCAAVFTSNPAGVIAPTSGFSQLIRDSRSRASDPN